MKKVFTAFLLIGLLFSCRTAQTQRIQLGMTKSEVTHHLRSDIGIIKATGARKLPNGRLEETIELKENYDITTFIFVDGKLEEWFTTDIRTVIPPMPYTEPPLRTEDKK